MHNDALEIRGLSRWFGEVLAVDQVDFDVPAGAMVGFVGGNGAGKTTTMRMIMGVLAIDAGEVRWAGRPVTRADRARFGYMPEERGLYPKQKILDQLVYLGRLHGMAAQAARTSATGYLERFGLGERTGDKLETLSLGNQQRVQIIAAVMAQPVALILDEPFSGLDPSAVDEMAVVLREHTERGVPVLFSSHQLDLVERLCDSLVVLSRGRVVAAGTAESLRRRETVRYRLVLGGESGWVGPFAAGLGTRPDGTPRLAVVGVDGPTAVVEPYDEQAGSELLREALSRGTVREFAPLVPSLSEIYREVTA